MAKDYEQELLEAIRGLKASVDLTIEKQLHPTVTPIAERIENLIVLQKNNIVQATIDLDFFTAAAKSSPEDKDLIQQLRLCRANLARFTLLLNHLVSLRELYAAGGVINTTDSEMIGKLLIL